MRAAVLLVLLPAVASAHAVGLSQGKYVSTARGLEAELTFTRSELPDEAPAAWVGARIIAPGCTLDDARSQPAERDGLTLSARWSCAAAPREVRLLFLSELPQGHRHLAEHQVLHAGAPVLALSHDLGESSRGAQALSRLQARRDSADATILRGSSSALSGLRAKPAGIATSPGFGGMVLLGVEHILTGWDHLLFLFGMVLVAARARAVLEVVTAFTLAHSLTLALGVLGVFAPSPRWVEPLIALSIAYVGIENLVVKDLEKRWRIAFGFGLLHGFGFAGALQDVGSSAAQLPLMLLGFNSGVEAGQLAVLAVLLPVLALLRRSERKWTFAKPALSALVVVPGLVWFALRLGS